MVEEAVRIDWVSVNTHTYAGTGDYGSVENVVNKLKNTFPQHKIKTHELGNTVLESLQNPENIIELSYSTGINCKGVYGGNLQYLRDSWKRTLKIAREFGKPQKVIDALKRGSCRAAVSCYELPKTSRDVALADVLETLKKHKKEIKGLTAVCSDGADFNFGIDKEGQGFTEMNCISPFDVFCKQYEKYHKFFVF